VGRAAAEVEDGKFDAADDAQPADDKPALLPKVARMADNMVEFAEKPKDVKILDEKASRCSPGPRPPLLRSLVDAQVQRQLLLLVLDRRHALIAYAMGKSPYGPFTYKGNISCPCSAGLTTIRSWRWRQVVSVLSRHAALQWREPPA
jgi:hypothetical protein